MFFRDFKKGKVYMTRCVTCASLLLLSLIVFSTNIYVLHTAPNTSTKATVLVNDAPSGNFLKKLTPRKENSIGLVGQSLDEYATNNGDLSNVSVQPPRNITTEKRFNPESTIDYVKMDGGFNEHAGKNVTKSGNRAMFGGARKYALPKRLPHPLRSDASNLSFVVNAIQKLQMSHDQMTEIKNTLSVGSKDSKSMLQYFAQILHLKELDRLCSSYMQRLPSVIIIGAKKAGTSFFNKLLHLHSRLAVSLDEVHYFDQFQETDATQYREMMRFSFPDQLTVDKTPKYWVTPDAPLHVRKLIPNVKLILLVRDPTCRFISDYHHSKKFHRFNTSLSIKDILTVPSNAAVKSMLVNPSLYDIHITNWLSVFPRNQIHIIRNEDLRTPKLAQVVQDVENFLGLNHEVDVRVSKRGDFVCIGQPRSSSSITCSPTDVAGTCLYEDAFTAPVESLRLSLRPHISKFEKIVNRTFNWF